MDHDAELADPLIEIRDVVESYLRCGVTPLDWHRSLEEAVAAIGRSTQQSLVQLYLPNLVPHLRILLEHGMEEAPMLTSTVAEQVAAVLRTSTIPGIPAPDAEYWGFDEISEPS